MKAQLAALLVTFGTAFVATKAHAKDVVVRRTFEVDKPSAAVVERITAYDQFCAQGCRYHVPSVATAKILSYARHDDDFYVWTSVKDIKDSTWFSHCTVRRTDGATRVEYRMVGEATGESLQKATKLEHAPAVDATLSVYELTEPSPGKTRVTLTQSVSLSGVSAAFGAGIARERLEQAVKAMQRDLSGS